MESIHGYELELIKDGMYFDHGYLSWLSMRGTQGNPGLDPYMQPWMYIQTIMVCLGSMPKLGSRRRPTSGLHWMTRTATVP